jgi:hypothetical protein
MLDQAGLTHGQIARTTGKQADAVRRAISHATASPANEPAKAKTAHAPTLAIPRRTT